MDSVQRKASTVSLHPSILPDILRTVTLEEILHAVDIVEEEDKRLEDSGFDGSELELNTGVLDADKGTVFLHTIGNYLDQTER